MRTIKLFVLTALASLMLVSSAFAFSIGNYSGPVIIKYSNWETRVTADQTSLSGIVRVTDILAGDGVTSLWSASTAPEEITGYFHNYALNLLTSTIDSLTTLYFTGGEFDFYVDSSKNFAKTVATAIDGTPFLTMSGLAGNFAGDLAATLQSVLVGNPTNFVVGLGTGYTTITGGEYAAMFGGAGTELLYQSTTYNIPDAGWAITSQDPMRANVVPEPGTMILLGVGLAGLGLVSRRKMKA
jgi:hypothetical protein